jgi:hypothetical protein
MADEFPLLFDLGLYVKDIRGDGMSGLLSPPHIQGVKMAKI